MADNDKILFSKILDGDETAVETAIRLWHSGFTGFLSSMVDAQDALDIAQGTYLKFIKNVHKLNNLEHAKRFVYKTGYHMAIDFIRKRNLGSRIMKNLAEISPAQKPAGRVEIDELLERALNTLSVKEKAALSLRFESGMTAKESARYLGIAQGTVLFRVHTALGKLRNFFEKHGYPKVLED